MEREINDWSGMSLGNDTDTGSGILEKFPVICSLCKKETTVPFKPEKGRPVYFKECVAKIKSGEVKVEKGREDQIKLDESKFYKPLADLGIEFEQKDGGKSEEKERYPERIDKPAHKPVPSGNIASAIKKIFHSEDHRPKSVRPAVKDNLALREVLNKNLSTPPIPEPVSLETLRTPSKPARNATPGVPGGDRAASSENMNKLKDLISKKVAEPPLTPGNIKEVPEDVLRKILEE